MDTPYISTGHLPSPEQVEPWWRRRTNATGSMVKARTRRCTRRWLGCPAHYSGSAWWAQRQRLCGRGRRGEFTIMSVSKPFVFALVCQELGVEEVRENRRQRHRTSLQLASGHRAGRRRADEPDGEFGSDRHHQPGAGRRAESQWQFIHDGLSQFAGRTLALNDEVYASASATNYRNQGIARLLQSYGRICMDPAEAHGPLYPAVLLDVRRRTWR